MLVHGAWYGGWAWEKVAPLLEGSGHRVVVRDLPRLGDDRTPPGEVTLESYAERSDEDAAWTTAQLAVPRAIGHPHRPRPPAQKHRTVRSVSDYSNKRSDAIVYPIMSRANSPRTRDGQGVGAVYERLRTAILRGEIAAGATVPQATLAEDFGAGRTPLREALRMLQRDGLVISEPNRSVRVAALSAEDFEELCIMRVALEAVAVRITVPTLKSADLAELEGYMAQMKHYHKVGDEAGMRFPHRAFHQLLVAASGPRVGREVAELSDQLERYRLRFGGHATWDERRSAHRGILDAAAVGDPDMAAVRLAEHYARTATIVFGALEPGRDLGRLRTAIGAVAPGAEAALGVS